MTFENAGWSTRPLRGVGLRQGCSILLLVFRWALADCMADMCEKWVGEAHGAQLETVTVSQGPPAPFDSTQGGLKVMLQDLAREARIHRVLVVRCETCGFAGTPREPPLKCGQRNSARA